MFFPAQFRSRGATGCTAPRLRGTAMRRESADGTQLHELETRGVNVSIPAWLPSFRRGCPRFGVVALLSAWYTPGRGLFFFRNNVFLPELCFEENPGFASAPPGHRTPCSVWSYDAALQRKSTIRGLCHWAGELIARQAAEPHWRRAAERAR